MAVWLYGLYCCIAIQWARDNAMALYCRCIAIQHHTPWAQGVGDVLPNTAALQHEFSTADSTAQTTGTAADAMVRIVISRLGWVPVASQSHLRCGPRGSPTVVIESQAIMVSIRVAIGKLIHAL